MRPRASVLILLHKNKSFTSLRCRSLLFLLLRDSVRSAHIRPTQNRSLKREGPGKAYAATPKQLTYAKPERINPDAYVSTGVFLFWFVFSFCVFNLLHAFKSLALFPPSGKTVARYFGATSGLWSFHSRRPTQIRLRTKRKNEQEKFSYACLSK